MERTVLFTVCERGTIEPSIPQYAGIQGEHNACRVVFAVDAWAGEPFLYRGEFVGGDGVGGKTAVLPVENNRVSFLLPAAWTAAGGRAVARLVASVVVNGEEMQTVFAVDAPLYFAVKQECASEATDEAYAGFTALAQAVQEAVEDVEQQLASGALKGEKGDTGPAGPQGDPGVYVGSGEMPEGYTIQIDPDGDATTDATLTQSGVPADALVTGERLQALDENKLDADKLPEAVEEALLQAKESGAFTGPQGEPGKNAHDKPWVLSDTITLTEDGVVEIVPVFPENTYKELYIEGVMKFGNEEEKAKTTFVSLCNPTTGYQGVRLSTTGNPTVAYYTVFKGNVSASGCPEYTSAVGASAYTGEQRAVSVGTTAFAKSDYLPAFSIMVKTDGAWFAAGTKFIIWGR